MPPRVCYRLRCAVAHCCSKLLCHLICPAFSLFFLFLHIFHKVPLRHPMAQLLPFVSLHHRLHPPHPIVPSLLLLRLLSYACRSFSCLLLRPVVYSHVPCFLLLQALHPLFSLLVSHWRQCPCVPSPCALLLFPCWLGSHHVALERLHHCVFQCIQCHLLLFMCAPSLRFLIPYGEWYRHARPIHHHPYDPVSEVKLCLIFGPETHTEDRGCRCPLSHLPFMVER